tara:strand:+ start:87 stop:296 length:210 start_codon:yes stop_codon:yes gene_type:complete
MAKTKTELNEIEQKKRKGMRHYSGTDHWLSTWQRREKARKSIRDAPLRAMDRKSKEDMWVTRGTKGKKP